MGWVADFWPAAGAAGLFVGAVYQAGSGLGELVTELNHAAPVRVGAMIKERNFSDAAVEDGVQALSDKARALQHSITGWTFVMAGAFFSLIAVFVQTGFDWNDAAILGGSALFLFIAWRGNRRIVREREQQFRSEIRSLVQQHWPPEDGPGDEPPTATPRA